MDSSDRDIEARAGAYASSRGFSLEDRLGFGKDGTVWGTSKARVVKAFRWSDAFERELAVYQRLAEHDVHRVCGHDVPSLHDIDVKLMILEMTTVRPPFLLDFAGAFLDSPPDFGEEVMEMWRQDKREQFGIHWPHVQTILSALERHGVYMLDIHPGNIAFKDESTQVEP